MSSQDRSGMMKSGAFAPRLLVKYGAVELKPIGKSLAMVVYRGYFGILKLSLT